MREGELVEEMWCSQANDREAVLPLQEIDNLEYIPIPKGNLEPEELAKGLSHEQMHKMGMLFQ